MYTPQVNSHAWCTDEIAKVQESICDRNTETGAQMDKVQECKPN